MIGNSWEFLGIPSLNLPWKFTPLFLGIPRNKAILAILGTEKLHDFYHLITKNLLHTMYHIPLNKFPRAYLKFQLKGQVLI